MDQQKPFAQRCQEYNDGCREANKMPAGPKQDARLAELNAQWDTLKKELPAVPIAEAEIARDDLIAALFCRGGNTPTNRRVRLWLHNGCAGPPPPVDDDPELAKMVKALAYAMPAGTADAKPEGNGQPANGWISASQAESELGWTHRQLKDFAQANPGKLHTQKPSKQRMEVWAADVLKLKSESSRKDFDALGTPAADKLPSISEAGMEDLAKRIAGQKK